VKNPAGVAGRPAWPDPAGPGRGQDGAVDTRRRSGLLVLRGGALGDFILTLPVIRRLRHAFPDERLEVVGPSGINTLAVHFRLADGARRLDDAALTPFFAGGGGIDHEWAAWFSQFRIVVSYLFDPDDTFHNNLRRAGVGTIVRGPHRPLPDAGHATTQLAVPLAALGLTFSENDRRMPIARWTPDSRIAIHPGSGSPQKSWSPTQWARVAAQLHHSYRHPVLVVAGEAESHLLPEFLSRLHAANVPCEVAHNLPLPQLADVLARCRLFIGHDTGPAHLAAACGSPCVLLFGPTDPAVWAPPGHSIQVIRPPDQQLTSIGVDTVIAAAVAVCRRSQ
jgi:heptosyltransferase III